MACIVIVILKTFKIYFLKTRNLPLSAYNPNSLCNLSILSLSQFLPCFLVNQYLLFCSSSQLPPKAQGNERRRCAEILNLNFMGGGRLWLGKTHDFFQYSRAIKIYSPLPLVFFLFLTSHFSLAQLMDRKLFSFLAESVFLWLLCCTWLPKGMNEHQTY